MDIHNAQQRLNRLLDRIRADEKILDSNKVALIKFANHCVSQRLKATSISKDLNSLRFVAIVLGKNCQSATKNDIGRVMQEVERQNWTPKTKRCARVVTKKFYKWLRGIDEPGVYPEEVRWILPGSKNRTENLPQVLNEDEIKRMIQAADNIRDKALVFTLYESGGRIDEILPLTISDVAFDENGAVLNVNGKTGSRRIRVIACAPLLASWLDNHPAKNDPKAFLWVTKFNRKNHGKTEHELLGYAAVRKILCVLAGRAGIRKRVYPHLLRHSRATILANKLTES